jgi:hypothetical protein
MNDTTQPEMTTIDAQVVGQPVYSEVASGPLLTVIATRQEGSMSVFEGQVCLRLRGQLALEWRDRLRDSDSITVAGFPSMAKTIGLIRQLPILNVKTLSVFYRQPAAGQAAQMAHT